ncbi:uncharacterized protein LOC125944321 [Dermacentor silvarum]|uniref:uncharacterized protein LOC125944321 n=1 Tax=Dermacentor silvarum TaxID=543639 RepID=UPI002101C3FD|nr:uncharacterized protein LOC125944321 [Dermacentor silvarum]
MLAAGLYSRPVGNSPSARRFYSTVCSSTRDMEHPAPERSARPPAPPRPTWTEAETWKLIRLWEDNLHLLRGEKHNTKVYAAIVDALRESGIIKTKKQVQGKLDNLTQRYRCRSGPASSTRFTTVGETYERWTYYYTRVCTVINGQPQVTNRFSHVVHAVYRVCWARTSCPQPLSQHNNKCPKNKLGAKELREHGTGSAATTWPFFRELHRFLGCLPSNDRSLTQESACSPSETVEEIIYSMELGAPVSANTSLVESGDEGEAAVVPTDPLSPRPGPSSTVPVRKTGKRKRTSANENFQNALLEQNERLIRALEAATAEENVLRERQMNIQEKLVELIDAFLKK